MVSGGGGDRRRDALLRFFGDGPGFRIRIRFGLVGLRVGLWWLVEVVEREEESVGEEFVGGVERGLREGRWDSPELELGRVGRVRIAAGTTSSQAAAVRDSVRCY